MLLLQVNPGSKAALRGVREGDVISSINSKSTKDITNSEAHSLLKNAGSTLKLGLNEYVIINRLYLHISFFHLNHILIRYKESQKY